MAPLTSMLASAFLSVLLAGGAAAQANYNSSFICPSGGPQAAMNLTYQYLGCYNDTMVSILTAAKISTIAMTPQFCANFCGERGFAYGGLNFATQCFCGATPNLQPTNNKLNDSSCSSKCATDPSQSCGATYIMSLLKITNLIGNASTGTANTAFTPACQTSPLCSQQICNTTLSTSQRIQSLVNSLTPQEKILNLVDAAAGSTRLGLPSYEWWSEGTHGVGSAPGVQFTTYPNEFSYATSFPAPILYAAAFDDELVHRIGQVIGKEGRAFGNGGFAGFDYWTPNMNAFRDPRWGRGQETPGEDAYHVSQYVRNFVPGLQGTDLQDKQIISTCKHYAVYDVETGRYGNDYNPSQQDLAEYFLASFKACVRDVNVGSIMCSYNAVDGVPSCANEYLLQTVLRDTWNFTADYQYVTSDCGAVTDIWNEHNFTNTEAGAAAVALNAGTDIECGNSYITLNTSLAMNYTTTARIDQALTRLYNALFTVGFFDGSSYDYLGWSDVATPAAQTLAYTAAVEGMTLLKNTNNFLPLSDTGAVLRVAAVGPFANATTQLQGDYSGTAKYLRSPLSAFQGYNTWDVVYAVGTGINTNSTSGFSAALAAASAADVVIYLGGIDNTLEAESHDRTSLAWPGNQLQLINQLAAIKPTVVVQFGGGQVDDTPLVNNANVTSIVWAGYPSQDGGPALLDILTGAAAPSGRLPVTQYPAAFVNESSIYDISLRPSNGTTPSPGRTYRWYTGTPVFPFGFGLHYTNFSTTWQRAPKKTYDIQELVNLHNGPGVLNDRVPFQTVTVNVRNIGPVTSDFSGLLFITSSNAGPTPRPIKTLVSYDHLHAIPVGATDTLELPLTLGSLGRADINGSLVIYPGDYSLLLDVPTRSSWNFTLTGSAAVIETLPPVPSGYSSAVPVNIQPPTTEYDPATGQ